MGLNLEEVPVPQFNGKHKLPNLAGIVFLAVLFVAVLIIGLAGEHVGFLTGAAAILEKYPTYVTPVVIAQYIVAGINTLWLLALIGFFVATLFLKNDFGRRYLFPEVANLPYVGVFSVALVAQLAFVFLFDAEQLLGAAIAMWIAALFAVGATVVITYNISCDSQRLKREQENMYWIYNILGVNGHATYATWCIFASLLLTVHALFYHFEVGMTEASIGALSTLLVLELLWFVLSNFVIGQYVRFILTPHLVVIIAAAGILVAHNEKAGTAAEVPQVIEDLNVGVLGVACALFVLRVAHVTFLQIKKPLRYT